MKEPQIEETKSALDETLVDILNSVTQGVGATKDFLIEQTPLVVQEILTWYATYNFILFVASILLFISVIVMYKNSISKSSAPNWMYDKDGQTHDDPRVMTPWVVMIFISVIGFHSINLQWLKIMIAPKLWLIEYTASLVK